jgi:hypothetical protein
MLSRASLVCGCTSKPLLEALTLISAELKVRDCFGRLAGEA